MFIALFVACNNDSKPIENETEEIAEEQGELKEIEHPQVDLISEQINASPENAELYFSRAVLNHKLKNQEAAILDFEKAIDLDNEEEAYYLNFAELHLDNREIIKGINVLSKGLEVLPESENINLALAKYYLYLGDPQKSIIATNRILKQSSTNVEAYFFKGLAYTQLKDTIEAISAYQTAVEQDPDHYNSFMHLGLLTAGKKMKLAEGYYKNAIRINEKSTEAIYGLGKYYQDSEQFQKAKNTYRKLTAVDPQYENAYYNIGYIYFLQDSLPSALTQFKIATKVAPLMAKGYYMTGLVHESMGNVSEARKDYNRALGLNPEFDMARKGLTRLDE